MNWIYCLYFLIQCVSVHQPDMETAQFSRNKMGRILIKIEIRTVLKRQESSDRQNNLGLRKGKQIDEHILRILLGSGITGNAKDNVLFKGLLLRFMFYWMPCCRFRTQNSKLYLFIYFLVCLFSQDRGFLYTAGCAGICSLSRVAWNSEFRSTSASRLNVWIKGMDYHHLTSHKY